MLLVSKNILSGEAMGRYGAGYLKSDNRENNRKKERIQDFYKIPKPVSV